MPKLTSAEFESRLRESPPRLLAVVGDEDFLREEIIAKVLAKRHGGAPRPEDLLQRSGSEKTAPEDVIQLFDDLRTPSLFGGEQTAIVEHAEHYLAIEPEAWVERIEAGWEGAMLILSLSALDGRTKLARALIAHGWVVEVKLPFSRPPPWKTGSPPWENELNAWIRQRAASRSLKLGAPAAHHLQSRVGTDLRAIALAIENFRTVLGEGGSITVELIDKHAPAGEETDLFTLIDALFGGERARALTLIESAIARGWEARETIRAVDPAALLLQFIGASLARARQIRLARAALARREGEEGLLAATGVSRPFLPRLRQQAERIDEAALARFIAELYRADRSFKRGLGPKPEELLRRLGSSLRHLDA